MHAARHARQVAVLLDVIQQVHAEVVQAEIGDGDAGLEVFHLDHFFLQAPQLLLAIGDVIRLPYSRRCRRRWRSRRRSPCGFQPAPSG